MFLLMHCATVSVMSTYGAKWSELIFGISVIKDSYIWRSGSTHGKGAQSYKITLLLLLIYSLKFRSAFLRYPICFRL